MSRFLDLVADLWHDLPWSGRLALTALLLALVFDLLVWPALVILGGVS